jgi:hypothetical protein
MVWAGHVVLMGTGEMRTGLWWGALMERKHFENLRIEGRIILKRIFQNWYGGMGWIDLVQDRNM